MIGAKFASGNKTLQGILVGAAAAALALVLWGGGALERWEYATWAWRVDLLAKPGSATHKVKLILLDQSSLDWGQEEYGWSWPWPREVYSAIIDFCKRNEARAVIFDVLYTESSSYGVADDQALGTAIQKGPPFVASLFLGRNTGAAQVWPPQVPLRALPIENLDEWLTSKHGKDARMPRATLPIMEVASNATLFANVADEPDMDGIFRRSYAFRVFDGHAFPALGFAAFLAGNSRSSQSIADSAQIDPEKERASDSHKPSDETEEKLLRRMTDVSSDAQVSPSVDPLFPVTRIERGSLRVGVKRIPIDDKGRTILRFRGPADTYETFSAAGVIKSELNQREGKPPVISDPTVFKDAYVFFGFSAPGLYDLRPIPISNVYPGVAIYATMLDNLLSDDFLQEVPRLVAALTALLLACLGGIAVARCNKVWHSTVCFVLLLPVPGMMGLLGYQMGYWWPVILPESAVAMALVGAVVLNYATVGRQKAFIKKAFRYYLSPAVIERILADPSQLKLGGERRELTILFSDLEGFSSISERLDPQALTSLLNDYLSDMTDIILEEGGTLDKYEGDAIIAFWSAPLTQPDHAVRSCRAAIRCQQKLRERRDEFEQRTGVPLRARIGINTGEVVVGNMGSHNRFDYTVLGDAANLASRLEGANKVFGTSIMVSEATFLQTSDRFVSREIGLLRVVGRKTPVRVYEIIAMAGEGDNNTFEEFHRGLALGYAGKWSEALHVFERLSDDPVAGIYCKRCRALGEGPAVEWDGVWNLTEK